MATYEDRLRSVGIEPSQLREMDLTELTKLSLSVTNGLVLDLYHLMEGCHRCTYYSLKEWLVILFGAKWPSENPPNVKAIRQSIVRLTNRLSRLKKERSTNEKADLISSFLDDEYSLPKVFVQHGKIVRSSSQSSSSSADCDRNSLLLANMKLSDELSQQSSELERKQEELAQVRRKMYSKHRNDQKKLKRRDQEIIAKKKEVEDGKKVIKHLQKNLSDQESSMESIKKQLDRLRHRASYWKSKASEAKQACDDEVIGAVIKEKETQDKLREELDALESENSELRATIEELMETASKSDICTFEKGKFKDNIRSCCYELLSLNVGVRNVGKVIRSVIQNIAEKSIDRLPSKTTLCEMMIESLSVAQAQLGEKLTDENKDFFTLHTDGTTKYGEHLAAYEVTTDDTTYSLGLRHVFSGSAKTTLDTLLEILDDLDVVCEKVTGSPVSKKVLLKIKNTMSDRHAAEKLFCTLLSDYREEILPDVVSNWTSLSDDQQSQLVRMNNFFCGLHYLVGLAECAEASVKLWESTVDEETQHAGTSGTQRLIRTSCKAFHSRGCEKSGCSIHFRTYLRSVGISNIPLTAFKGNRFNILFYDGAGVFFLREHFEKYLTDHHNGPLNKLLSAVLADLRVEHYIAGCRALGIVDKIVTGPFWRKLESSTVSILNLGDVYTKMKHKFEEWSEDASCLISKEDTLFPEYTNLDDDIGKSLFMSSSNDVLTQEALQLLFKSFSATTQRLVLEHLPGGEYHIIEDQQVAAEVKYVPKTNVAPERDFAILDRLLSEKPNASYIALESLLLYSQNKTSEWLNSKSEAEQTRLLNAARCLTSVHKANFKKRREALLLKRSQLQRERERERERKREREVQEKEDLTKRLAPFGLWSSVREVEHGLQLLKNKKDKQEALKIQLSFRRKVLGQTHQDKTIFFFSHNRKPLTEYELKQNLHKLLPPPEQVQTFVNPSDILDEPELLIYRRIEHCFNCDGLLTWFRGTVLSFNKETMEYRVQYDDEEDTFSFPLLDDLKSNDLRVLN